MKTVAVILALLVLVLTAVIGFGAWRWRARTSTLAARLRPLSAPHPLPFRASQLTDLPPPVARYFRAVLREGQPLFAHVRLRQRGQFLIDAARHRWTTFVAVEEMSAEPAGFLWDARMRMGPGMSVRVRDAFIGAEGSMHASLLGLKTMMHLEGTPEIAQGALQRYLAEAAWLPTALLPAAGVRWTLIDDSTARASLTVGATVATLDFSFGPDSLIATVYAAGRPRAMGDRTVPTPWQGRWSRYQEHEGMRIPMTGEVGWVLTEGPQTYWKGEVIGVEYGRAEGRVTPSGREKGEGRREKGREDGNAITVP